VAFLIAILAMGLKDSIGTMLVIAEAHNRYVLAGALAALADLAGIFVTLAGAGVIITHGWSVRTAGILGVMMCASFAGTLFWTWFGNRFQGTSK
jgi:hypothetical protein